MLLLYAITDSARTPARSGLRGSPLRAIGDDDLFAISSEHEHPHAELVEADLWAYEEAVEATMEVATVLPMRLGSSLPDEAAVRDTLRLRRPELRAALERVKGAVELGVRAVVPIPDGGEPELVGARVRADEADVHGPGTAYMLGRLEAETRAANAVAQIHAPLASLARESVRRAGSGRAGVLNASYLVDRLRVEPFRERVEALSDGFRDAAIVCTGPWPPYSFSAAEPVR